MSSAMTGTPEQIGAGRVACSFVYANGKGCPGHIVRIEAYKADIEWALDDAGAWRFGFAPRSHYHLFCSEKGNHAGFKQHDDQQMKFHWRELPDGIRNLLESTDPRPADAPGQPPG